MMNRIFNEKIILPICNECDGFGFVKNENGEIIQANGIDLRCKCFYANKFLDSNIGFDYWNINEDNFQGEKEDLKQISIYFDKIDLLKSEGRGFYIYGPAYGIGKSTLSAMLIKHVLFTTNYSCLFVPFSDLVILNTKLMIGSFDKTIDEKINAIKNVDFLVLDDLAKEYDNQKDNGRATLNSVLRYRDLWNKSTIYTANVPIDNVTSLYGGSNYSIIYGRSILINMINTNDFRRDRKRIQKRNEKDS
jgi:DNA replication protein DnaC